MSKHSTFKKIVATAVVTGAAMYLANKYIIDKATEKDLLNDNDGNFFDSKYGEVYYKVSGEGTPILLIHDLNETSSGVEFSRLEKLLSEKYKVFTIDLLGCGRSEKPKLTYNTFLYVQIITDFIKEVIGEPTNIIVTGKSTAPVVMAAKLEDKWINKIIMINPVDLVTLDNTPDKLTKLKNGVILSPILGTFVYHLAHTKDKISEQFMTDYFSNPEKDFEELADHYYEAAHRDESANKYLYASIIGNHLNMNINHGLKSLDKEILIISGEDYYESDYVPEDYAILNENVEAVTIMDTSYLPHLEAPEKVMDLIEQYWD